MFMISHDKKTVPFSTIFTRFYSVCVEDTRLNCYARCSYPMRQQNICNQLKRRAFFRKVKRAIPLECQPRRLKVMIHETIFSGTQSCNVGAMLQLFETMLRQCHNAVL